MRWNTENVNIYRPATLNCHFYPTQSIFHNPYPLKKRRKKLKNICSFEPEIQMISTKFSNFDYTYSFFD